MVDPLSYFSFQPVLHDWCNKGGMNYLPRGLMHIKDPVLLIGKNIAHVVAAVGFLSLSPWYFTIFSTP